LRTFIIIIFFSIIISNLLTNWKIYTILYSMRKNIDLLRKEFTKSNISSKELMDENPFYESGDEYSLRVDDEER